jgi:hypothetical protein
VVHCVDSEARLKYTVDVIQDGQLLLLEVVVLLMLATAASTATATKKETTYCSAW